MKIIYVDWDEWYPYFSFSETENWWARQIEVTEEELDLLNQAKYFVDKAQRLLREKVNDQV